MNIQRPFVDPGQRLLLRKVGLFCLSVCLTHLISQSLPLFSGKRSKDIPFTELTGVLLTAVLHRLRVSQGIMRRSMMCDDLKTLAALHKKCSRRIPGLFRGPMEGENASGTATLPNTFSHCSASLVSVFATN